MKRTKVVVKQDEEVVEVRVLAKAIIEISASLKRLDKSGLNRKALVVLLMASTNYKFNGQYKHPTRPMVEAILDGLDNLAKDYCK